MLTGPDALMLARKLARENHLFIVEVSQKGVPAFVLYRKKLHPGGRATRLGRRKDPGELLALVRTYTGQGEAHAAR